MAIQPCMEWMPIKKKKKKKNKTEGKGIVKDLIFLTNSYHQNIKFTIKISLTKFLDTKLSCLGSAYKTMLYKKATKFSIYLSSKVQKHHKRNAIF